MLRGCLDSTRENFLFGWDLFSYAGVSGRFIME